MTGAGSASGRLQLGSFAGYHRSWARGDVVAGLTVWAVLVPEPLAHATVAGVPPVVGLYAAVPALVLYAVLGSSRHLVVSPMSAAAALSAVDMLVQLGEDLAREGRSLALAQEIGQVRDVLSHAAVAGEPVLFATIDDAVAAAP